MLNYEISKPVTFFVWYSLVTAILHFIMETAFHLKHGQFLPMLIVDYIAIGLLLFGGIGFLWRGWGPGLLCGAWGFEFCLNYRTFFSRIPSLMDGSASEVTTNTAYLLGSLLTLSAIAFIWSIFVCVSHAKVRYQTA